MGLNMSRRRQNFTPSYHQRRADARQDHLWKQDMQAHAQADKMRYGIDEKAHAEAEKWRRELDTAQKGFDREAAEAVKRVLSTPITRWTGGCRQQITVHHWRCPQNGAPFGAVLTLHAGRADAVQSMHPALHEVLAEVKARYRVLPKLTDNRWAGQFFRTAGLTSETTATDSVDGGYGAVDRKVTTVHVPELTGARISLDGLELRYAQRGGDSAAAWQSKVPNLRAAFKAQGVDAGHMVVVEGKDGSTVLRFNDAPSAFPPAVAPPVTNPAHSVEEAKRRYRDFRWMLGVDAQGTVIAPSIREVYHVLAVGGTGSGKSVWVRGLIESARLAGFRVYLADGKSSDYPALENEPGVIMRSSDAAQHIVLVAEVHDEMVRRQAVAEKCKREGHPDPFDFEPILMVLDEFASLRGDVFEFVGGKKAAMEPWLNAIAAVSRKGRELKVHMVLASQDLYVENIPNQWQGNFQLLVSLGEIEDKTLDTKFIPDTLKDEAKRVGSRITRKDRGRGLFVDKSNPPTVRIREFQSFYSFSPGSTRLEAGAQPDVSPPTAEVRAVWEKQRDAAAQMPRLYPRIGIKVDDPDWSDATVSELMKVPTVALDDRDGNPIPSMARYDHRTVDWLGREQVSVAPRRGSAMLHGEEAEGECAPPSTPHTAAKPEPTTEPTEPPTAAATEPMTKPVTSTPTVEPTVEPKPADVTTMTDAERKEAIRQEAIRMGLLPADDEDKPTPAAEDKPTTKPKPAPRNGDGSTGDDF